MLVNEDGGCVILNVNIWKPVSLLPVRTFYT